MSADFTNPFAGLDPSSFDVNKMMENLKVPGVDWKALMDSQAKNLAALSEANQLALQGMQAVAKRQMEILQQTMSEAASAAKQAASNNARDAIGKQSELAKQAFEQAITNMRELADMIQKNNREAFDVVSRRVSAGLSELKDRVK